VIERVASLHEIEAYWSIDDLADAHEALDIRHEAQARAAEKIKRP
jgi:hypothetical protein